MRSWLIAAALLLCAANPARADVIKSSPSAFQITATAEANADQKHVWRAITRVGHWWQGVHTYSGDARHLSLNARAGGCFCERWSDGSVEHGRVIAAFRSDNERTLRLDAPLGPLQEMGVTAIWTFKLSPGSSPNVTRVTMTYRVSGDMSLGLDHLAGPVDSVMMEQFRRLIRYTNTGVPN